ncbi:protein neprosin-like [Quercus suber]|uniref:Neprosin PEP catalytic domain-containing protein n=1 Tax=Quercus suber TaxID=58331 RepID=A0AAW0MBY6_QUESU
MGTMSAWKPQVQEPNEHSVSQILIQGSLSASDVSTIAAGWQIAPYNDTGRFNLLCLYGFVQITEEIVLGGTIKPLSVYNGAQFGFKVHIWKIAPYSDTGCFNLLCLYGFVQITEEIVFGGTIKPLSVYNGAQFGFKVHIWKDPREGVWWLEIENKILGYWPDYLFLSLSERGSEIQWGGEVLK